MARSRGEESELNIATGQKTPPPRAASTVYFSMDDEVRPQPGVLQHTAAHVVDILPYVQILEVPVPQLGNQVVEFMQTLDTATLEQVIEVPKLSQDRIPQRSAVRRPQKAEQLVEVPTVLTFSSLQQTAEQIIDSRTLIFPFPEVALHVLPDLGGSSSSAVSRDERGEAFFRTFPWVRSPPPVRVRGCPQGRAHGLGRLMRGVRLRTSTTSTSNTTAPCLRRLGTSSTSVTVGVKSVVKMATVSCRCMCRFGALSDLEPLRYIVMAM